MKIKITILLTSLIIAIAAISVEYAAWEEQLEVKIKINPIKPQINDSSTNTYVYQNVYQNS